MYIKYSELSRIVLNEVEEARIADGYMGGRGDYSKDYLLTQLNEVKQSIIFKADLRPSEYKIIDDMEVNISGKLEELVERFKFKEWQKGLK
jgi:hypothetical protein